METKNTGLVVKSNALIEASYRLSLTEQRIILAAIVEARETQKGLGDGALTIYAKKFTMTFSDVDQKNAYAQLKDAVKDLFKRYVTIKDIHEESGKPRITEARWISSSSYINGIGAIQIRLSPEIIPYIIRLENEFTAYRLEKIGKLSTGYAVRLYEILLQYLQIGYRNITISELKNLLGVDQKEYLAIKDFKKRVIDPSLDQINEHTDLLVSYENVKVGRSVEGLLFTIEEKKPPLAEVPKKTTVKRPKITKAYIEKNARPGETYEQAYLRLSEKNS
jgi:plasmid replication initiation protein